VHQVAFSLHDLIFFLVSPRDEICGRANTGVLISP